MKEGDFMRYEYVVTYNDGNEIPFEASGLSDLIGWLQSGEYRREQNDYYGKVYSFDDIVKIEQMD